MDKIKITFKKNDIELVAMIENSVDNVDDLRKFVKTCKRALVDLSENELQRSLEKGENQCIKNAGFAEEYYGENYVEENVKPVEYASDGQKRYMDKLGIPYTANTTKYEAIDLINEWKVAHNVPLGNSR